MQIFVKFLRKLGIQIQVGLSNQGNKEAEGAKIVSASKRCKGLGLAKTGREGERGFGTGMEVERGGRGGRACERDKKRQSINDDRAPSGRH